MDGGNRAGDRQVVFILTEDVGAEDRQIDVVHGDFTHFWQRREGMVSLATSFSSFTAVAMPCWQRSCRLATRCSTRTT
ncbi:hypothetical protein EYF80_043264 [Liparis tanakae]|uniref:Uncharacterized protein n=1 Tax=Liparis tanakae TaxID=230148 RepID=A0A4Z2G1Y6_9TELE|nr:hypothetical protein EYF80_043264 [Liparis tanakae]